MLRNSKERTSLPTASFSSNLDIDEVTKTLPNKGRKITIVTPSTATIPRKLVLFPSTTTTQRTENTDTAFQTDNFNNRKLSSIQRKTKITDKYNSLDTSALVSSLPSLPSSESDDYKFSEQESTIINHRKPEKYIRKQPRRLLIARNRGKPINVQLPTNSIPYNENRNSRIKTTDFPNRRNVSHSVSVVSVKYSFSGPGIGENNVKVAEGSKNILPPKISPLTYRKHEIVNSRMKGELDDDDYEIDKIDSEAYNDHEIESQNIDRSNLETAFSSSTTAHSVPSEKDKDQTVITQNRNVYTADVKKDYSQSEQSIPTSRSKDPDKAEASSAYIKDEEGHTNFTPAEKQVKDGFVIPISTQTKIFPGKTSLSNDEPTEKTKVVTEKSHSLDPTELLSSKDDINNKNEDIPVKLHENMRSEMNNLKNISIHGKVIDIENLHDDIDERDGKSIRSQKNIIIKMGEPSKDASFHQNEKEKDINRNRSDNARLETINQPVISSAPSNVKSNEDISNEKIHKATTNHKLIIHLSNNQNYSIKVGSPHHSFKDIKDSEHLSHKNKISIKTRIQNLSSSSRQHDDNTLKQPKVLSQQNSSTSSYNVVGGDGDVLKEENGSSKSQTNLKSDTQKSFYPAPHAALRIKTSENDEGLALSFNKDGENKRLELNNVQEKPSYKSNAINERDEITIKNNSHVLKENDEENRITIVQHRKELDSNKNNDQIQSGEKSPKEIAESDDLDDDYQININKEDHQSLLTESKNKVKVDENSFQSPINDEAIISDTTSFSDPNNDHVGKKTNSTSILTEFKHSEKDKDYSLIDNIQENDKNTDPFTSHNDKKSFNNKSKLSNESKNDKLSNNKVQYTPDNGSGENKVDNNLNISRHSDKSLLIGDKPFEEEAELLEASPSIREYFNQGQSKPKNIKDNLITYNKDVSSDDEISTTRKYKTEKFALDYEEYSDETSFFGSDSSNDEVIPSQYEDAATYHEILVGAAQDPRYEHDEYVEEKDYRGNRREYFPLNSDEETLRTEEYPERQKRPRIEINAVVGISVGAFFFILLGTCKLFIIFSISKSGTKLFLKTTIISERHRNIILFKKRYSQ